MTENKKIKGATEIDYEGIHFKSLLEMRLYKYLKEQNFDVKYEPIKFILIDGFHPTIPFYIIDKKTRQLKEDTYKIRELTYSPDLVFYYNNHRIIIEVKAFENDVYPVKRKLFRKYLEENDNYNTVFAQIGTIKQLKQFIKILEEQYNEKSE